MTYQQFIDNLEDSYDGNFGQSDLKELKDFFLKNNINEIGIQNLYNAIKYNYTQQKIPKFAHIVKFYNEHSQFKSQGIEGSLHPQSPLQELYRAKDWPVDKILQNCELIRKKQDQVGISGLHTWELSFISIWERLKNVTPAFRNIAKSRIINNAKQELSSPINLQDLMPELKPEIKTSMERKEKTVNMKTALGDIL